MTLVAERYALGAVLGVGGTATVYRAEDRSLGVERAIKILGVGANQELRERLRTEARLLAAVDHPSVLRVFDVGSFEGRDYVVMELLTGGTLQDRLDAGGPFPVPVAGRVALQMFGALAAAHDAGVIHRDVKPHNVLLDKDGLAKLADFGIALSEEADGRYTRTGVAMGSLAYMAPEQRLDARRVSAAADVYAAAATLYAVLTGASPMDLFAAPPSSPRWSDVPAALRPMLQRATRYEPKERQPTVRRLAIELLEAMQQMNVDDQGDPAWDGIRERVLRDLLAGHRIRGRLSRLWIPAAVAATTALGLAVMLLLRGTPPAAPPASSPPAAVTSVPSLPSPSPPVATTSPVLPSPVPPPPAPSPAPSPPVAASKPTAPPTVRTASTSDRVVVTRSDGASKAGDLAGRWTGSFAGRVTSLELEGPDGALRGKVRVRFQGQEVTSDVAGAFTGGTLVLDDVDTGPDAGRYEAALTSDGALDGRFEAREGGRRVAFRFQRTP
jgi:serine/threonine-protein kinase